MTSPSRSHGRSLCRCGWSAAPPWSSPMTGGRRRSPGASWETAACFQSPARNPCVCSILGRDRRGQDEDRSVLDTRMLFMTSNQTQNTCGHFDDYLHFSSFRRPSQHDSAVNFSPCEITTPHSDRMCPANEIAALLLECTTHYPVTVCPFACELHFVPGQAVIMCSSHIFAFFLNLRGVILH